MDTRREFLKKATLLSGVAGMNSLIPAALQRALAIEPNPGSSWEDAEHIVILMQENRSFDHCFGTLRGVRGYNDPRAIRLPNKNPVWLQSNPAGETYAPFHLDIKDTRATWMSSLPHSWKNQVNARNDGRYDQWLTEKRNSIKEYADMPLTLGYYTREDIPFYYALADGFTVCDQHFCSSLTGTDPNRLFFWTGTIRAEQHEDSRALVWNEDVDLGKINWRTFPELLEDHDISWKFYQNEVSIDVGFKGEEDAWLSNFEDNPLEYFSQYNVHLLYTHLVQLENLTASLPDEISLLQKQLDTLQPADPSVADVQKKLQEKKKALDDTRKELEVHNHEAFKNLSPRDKSIHQKAFVTNINDADYHTLESFTYQDNSVERSLMIPKGDLLHQFREDVNTGKLPTVSWLAAPENLSDHPSSAWYGAWYVSEVMDILTKNPEVWKKTIFILTYDENDGYFDHVPPFVAPHSDRTETGRASQGLDTKVEFVTALQEAERKGFPNPYDRESPIGLGYRVPLIIASPWSRGGFVNSEVFDHTSTLQFLETFLSKKTGKSVHESNISDWRRSVCGNLTSVFRPLDAGQLPVLDYLKRKPFMETIHNAKFKKLPSTYKALNPEEINQFQKDPYSSSYMPEQERGIKPANALNYQLYAEGKLNASRKSFEIQFEASNEIFGKNACGSPFNVYAPGKYLQMENGQSVFKDLRTWAFALKSPDQLSYSWPLDEFENSAYHLCVYGPNGFFREFKGSAKDPVIDIQCEYQRSLQDKNKLTGNIVLFMTNPGTAPVRVVITDNAYRTAPIKKILHPGMGGAGKTVLLIDLSKQFGWYDFTVQISGDDSFEKRYAGKVENGKIGYSDPYMGRII